jgi:hypothetical protein
MNLQDPVKYRQIPGKPTRATVSNPGHLITILKEDNRRSFELTRSLTREEIDSGVVNLNNSETWGITGVSEDLSERQSLLGGKNREIRRHSPWLMENWK